MYRAEIWINCRLWTLLRKFKVHNYVSSSAVIFSYLKEIQDHAIEYGPGVSALGRFGKGRSA